MKTEQIIIPKEDIENIYIIFENLGMYPDYYGIEIDFKSGKHWKIRIEEHEYDDLKLQMKNDK